MSDLIPIVFQNHTVYFNNDAYLNATAIASEYAKRAQYYLENKETQEYIAELKAFSKGRIPAFHTNQLVTVKKGSPENGGGTWLHPKLAVHFARWLNPKFAIWCDDQIMQIMIDKSNAKLLKITYFELPKPSHTEFKKMERELREDWLYAWQRPVEKHAAFLVYEGFMKANDLVVDDGLKRLHEDDLVRREHPIMADFWAAYDLLKSDVDLSTDADVIWLIPHIFLRKAKKAGFDLPLKDQMLSFLRRSLRATYIGYQMTDGSRQYGTVKCWVFHVNYN